MRRSLTYIPCEYAIHLSTTGFLSTHADTAQYSVAPQVAYVQGQDGLQVAPWESNAFPPPMAKAGSESIQTVLPKTHEPHHQKPAGLMGNMKQSTFWLLVGLVSLLVIGA